MRIIVGSTELSDRHFTDDQLSQWELELVAYDGDVASGTIVLPDSDGDDEWYHGTRVQVLTDDGHTIYDGFIDGITRERGSEKADPNRQNVIGLVDGNAIIQQSRLTNWNRPAEDVRDRILALIATAKGSNIAPSDLDTSWVRGSNVILPPKTYDGMNAPLKVIGDSILYGGYTFYVVPGALGREVHWHPLSEGPAATISISDDPHAIGSNVFAPIEPRRIKSAADLENDVLAEGADGITASAVSLSSKATYDAGGLPHQGYYKLAWIEKLSELQHVADVILANKAEERVTYHLSIGPLTELQVPLLGAGQQIPITSHVLGLSGSVQRISRLTWRVAHGGGPTAPTLWTAEMEIADPIREPQDPLDDNGQDDEDLPKDETPCAENEDLCEVGTVEYQTDHMFGGTPIDAYGIGYSPGGASVSTSLTGVVGYDYAHTEVILGYMCGGPAQYHSATKTQALMTFDTRDWVKEDCLIGALLHFTISGPDCACGPYEVFCGGQTSGDAASGAAMLAQEGANVIGEVDLSQETGVNEATYDIPLSCIDFGGYTTIGIRAKWDAGAAIVCASDIEGGDMWGSVHCSDDDDVTKEDLIANPNHWQQPYDVHQAKLGDAAFAPRLCQVIATEGDCGIGWVDAICATDEDSDEADSSCGDPCCTHVWKVPCARYRPGTLEVSVGGRILERGKDFIEMSNHKTFRLLILSCEVPQVRYAIGGQ